MDKQAIPATTTMARYRQNSLSRDRFPGCDTAARGECYARPLSQLRHRGGTRVRGRVDESRRPRFERFRVSPHLGVASPCYPALLLHRRNTFVAAGALCEAVAHQRHMLPLISAG